MRLILAAFLVLVSIVPAQESALDDLAALRATPTLELADATAARLRSRPAELLALIEELGRSTVWTERRVAARLLGWAPPETAALIGVERFGLHRDGSWPVREQLFLAIAEGDAQVHAVVADGLKDAIARVRMAAVRAAALLATTATSVEEAERDVLASALAEATTDASGEVRHAAVSALMGWAPSHAITERLREALRRDLPRRLAREIGATLLCVGYRPDLARPFDERCDAAVDNDILKLVDVVRGVEQGDGESLARARALLLTAGERAVYGRELIDRLLAVIADDADLARDMIFEACRRPESAALCRLALAPSRTVPWPDAALRAAMLRDVMWGRDPVEAALDELAVLSDPSHAEALEAFCVVDDADEDSRRVALRILLDLDATLSPPLDAWLRRPERGRLAAEYAEQRWLRGTPADRVGVVADLRRWFGDEEHERLAAGVLSRLGRQPSPELAELLRERLPKSAQRGRAMIVDALARLGDDDSRDALKRLLATTDDMSLVRRIERHLIDTGDAAVVNDVLTRATNDQADWRAASLEDLVTLRDSDDARVVAMAEARLVGRHFDDRSLGHLIEIVRRRKGRDAALEHLGDILSRAGGDGAWPGPDRVPLSGNVLGGLLETLEARTLSLAALDCVGTGRVAQLESLLDAVTNLGSDDADALARRLLDIWRDLPAGVADIELRAALLGPLMAHAGDDGRAIVVDALHTGLASFVSELRHRELHAELAARAAGVLVRRGGAGEITLVMDAVAGVEDVELLSVLLWSFTEARDVAAIEKALRRYVRSTGILPESMLTAWVEGAIASRRSGHPLAFIADVILDRPLARAVVTRRGLVGLALRLADRGDDGSRALALRLVRRGLRIARVSPHRHEGSLRVDHPSPRELEWLAHALGDEPPPSHRWARRIDVERMIAFADLDESVDAALRACGPGLRSAEILRGKLRRRLDVEPAAVLEVSRLLARASRSIPAGSPLHARPDYEILEAAALWRLDRRDEARTILRRHGWPRTKRLPELTPDAFPGLRQ